MAPQRHMTREALLRSGPQSWKQDVKMRLKRPVKRGNLSASGQVVQHFLGIVTVPAVKVARGLERDHARPPHTRKRSPPARETSPGQLCPGPASGPTPAGAVFCSKDNEATREAFCSAVTTSLFLECASLDGSRDHLSALQRWQLCDLCRCLFLILLLGDIRNARTCRTTPAVPWWWPVAPSGVAFASVSDS